MRRRWILWGVLLLLCLWPVWLFTRYALDFEPGGGPQGGEAVALLALLFWMLWQLIATVHWALLKRRREGAWWQRLGVALAPCAALVLAIAWTEAEGPALPAGLIVAALLAGSQGWAVARLGR